MSSGAFEGKALLIKRVTDANNADLNRLSSVCVYVCFVVSPLGGVVIFFLTWHPKITRQPNDVI